MDHHHKGLTNICKCGEPMLATQNLCDSCIDEFDVDMDAIDAVDDRMIFLELENKRLCEALEKIQEMGIFFYGDMKSHEVYSIATEALCSVKSNNINNTKGKI